MRARISALIAVILISLASPLSITDSEAAVANSVGVTQSNLLMYFDLANPAGISGTSLTDLSGNFVASTLIQTSSQPSFNTNNGKHLSFNANGGYVDVPDIVSASNWSGLSVSFYANMGTRTTVERIFDFGNGSQANNIWVGMGDLNDMVIEVWHDNASPGWCRSANGSVGANEWAHWAVVLDGATCKWYKNNTLSQSTNYTYLPWARTLTNNYLGKSNWNDPYFEGGIGDLAIYKSALSDSQRLQNYNAQTDITPPAISGNLLSSPENQLSVTTLNFEAGASYYRFDGYDSTKLNLSSNGVLTFASNPNFEAQDSYYSNYQYRIDIRVVDANGNFIDTYVQVTLTNVLESASLTPPSIGSTPSKGISLTITVTPSGDGTALPGKVTYLFGGKRIPGCYKKSYAGSGNSTCTFEPSLRGFREVSVTFTPTNTNFSAATSKKTFFFNKRTNAR